MEEHAYAEKCGLAFGACEGKRDAFLQTLRDWQPPETSSVVDLLKGIDERLARYPMEGWLERSMRDQLQYAKDVNSTYDMLVVIGLVARLWKPASKVEMARIATSMQSGEMFVFPTDVARGWIMSVRSHIRQSFELYTLLRVDDLMGLCRAFILASPAEKPVIEQRLVLERNDLESAVSVLLLADCGEMIRDYLKTFDIWASAALGRKALELCADQQQMMTAISWLEPTLWWGVYGVIS